MGDGGPKGTAGCGLVWVSGFAGAGRGVEDCYDVASQDVLRGFRFYLRFSRFLVVVSEYVYTTDYVLCSAVHIIPDEISTGNTEIPFRAECNP
jgi:hypothetical protein